MSCPPSCSGARSGSRRLRRRKRGSKRGKRTRIGEKGRTPDDGRKGRGTKPFARDFGVPPDDAQDNFTDPESRIMKTSYGFDQCYNGQLAVDEASQLIVATGLTNCAADNARIAAADRSGPRDARRAIPSKCWPMRAIAARRAFRPLRRAASRPTFRSGMKRGPRSRRTRHTSRPSAWPRDSPATAGRARYRRRKAIVEPVIGWIKEVLGFRRFSVRGEVKARGEWNLVCLAVNLKRLCRLSLT